MFHRVLKDLLIIVSAPALSTPWSRDTSTHLTIRPGPTAHKALVNYVRYLSGYHHSRGDGRRQGYGDLVAEAISTINAMSLHPTPTPPLDSLRHNGGRYSFPGYDSRNRRFEYDWQHRSDPWSAVDWPAPASYSGCGTTSQDT